MDRLKISLLVCSLSISPFIEASSAADLSNFDRYLAEQNETNQRIKAEQLEFDSYKQSLEDDFSAYKRLYEEEFKTFQSQIMKQWGEFKDSDQTSWVSYPSGGKVRRSVNFESGDVEIAILLDNGLTPDDIENSIQKQIADLLSTTERQAFEGDQVASSVERRLLNEVNVKAPGLVKKGTLSDQPLFSEDVLSQNAYQQGFIKVSSADNRKIYTRIETAKVDGKSMLKVSFNMSNNLHRRAVRFKGIVNTLSIKENIPAALIFSIMETESSFNPMAKSHIPAFGLMQIVPRSAGKDATKYLYGEAKILSPSFLFSAENNITIGSAYLHILYYKYLRKIKDPQSRLYCTMAAYNTGPGNVAKAFIGIKNFGKAVSTINGLTSKQVYNTLQQQLSSQESRHYIERVSKRMNKYLGDSI